MKKNRRVNIINPINPSVVLMIFLSFIFFAFLFAILSDYLNRPMKYIDSATYECVAVDTKDGLLPPTLSNCKLDAEDVYVAPGSTYEKIFASRRDK